MEEHRLKPMVEGYDPKLFNHIFSQTEVYRRKLAYEVDARRFGVEYQDVLSWFNIKFIHAFNRYVNEKEPEILKAYIINSLRFFKNKLLRYSYYQKNQINVNSIDITDVSHHEELHVQYEDDLHEIFLNTALSFLEDTLSNEAFQLLKLELNPPLFVIDQLSKYNKIPKKIPPTIISEFFDWGEKGIKKINTLRKEIKRAILLAKDHFDNQAVDSYRVST